MIVCDRRCVNVNIINSVANVTLTVKYNTDVVCVKSVSQIVAILNAI